MCDDEDRPAMDMMSDLRAENERLRDALKKACDGWRGWVHDQLDGTDGLEEALEEIRAVEELRD